MLFITTTNDKSSHSCSAETVHLTRIFARRKKYLDVIGEPVEVWVCVLHGEQDVSPGNDLPLGDGFDADREAAVVPLKHTNAGVREGHGGGGGLVGDTEQASRRESYLHQFPPALFVEHRLLEVHVVERFGLLNLLLRDYASWGKGKECVRLQTRSWRAAQSVRSGPF